ncbi:hypothetical protein EVJ58_g8946 [Rhodofomes roseus]|uniref:CxC2-like cysteine cluster KDZ transposase-associated domain-containing protein n=1 Tax=Rhodofomes roseus TaxID=34475 RepID=A0A4Y9Y0B1_9APHY|nr:hypothetical protein EVJ58_g8946 [Rhodofomes roseus]
MSTTAERSKRPRVEVQYNLPNRVVKLTKTVTVLPNGRKQFFASTTYRPLVTPPRKRPRLASPPRADHRPPHEDAAGPSSRDEGPNGASSSPGDEKATGAKGRTVKNGISKVLNEWKPRFPDIIEDILASEAPTGINVLCACGRSMATTRCRDCFQGALQCPDCVVEAHRWNPLHWVEVWNGSYLEKKDLSDLGFELYLGHGGLPCRFALTLAHPITYTVTHTNGIHRVRVHQCHCPPMRDTVSQLLRAGLFPATLNRPESAFTFDVLRQWDLHFLTSKKGTYDYYEALRRLTDNSGTRVVKDRYRELNIVGRIWQHLTALKRAGAHHGLTLPNRLTSMTVPCVACPLPNFNMPANWKDTPPDLAYIHACELGGDGNHGLQKKRKRDDPNDVSLSEGQGYFVDPAKTKTYLEEIDSETPPETCSGFKVGRAQRPGKFRNVEVSGVVAVICIRHGCFRPGAMVDLQKGERYGHMDFALAGALEGLDELLHFIFTYDVACIYGKNMRKRFAARFPHLLPLIDRMQLLLPKLHMLAHKELCQILFALCYSWGAGLSHGESVEHPWAEHNQVGLSTREMGPGHRHDALNAIHNYWNWRKMEGIASFLARKLKEAFTLQDQKKTLYDALSKVAGDKVRVWEKMEGPKGVSTTSQTDDVGGPAARTRAKSKSKTKGKGKRKSAGERTTQGAVATAPAQSVYVLDETKVPSAGKAYEDLSKLEINPKAEFTAAAAGKVPSGTVNFFQKGLAIEQRQYEIRAKLKNLHRAGTDKSDDSGVGAERRTLHRELERWRELQTSLMPHIDFPEIDVDDGDFADDEDGGLPEDEPLALPSDYSAAERADLDLDGLAVFERRIRIGHAYDLLNAVKMSLNHQGAFLSDKRKHARGQKDNTRAQKQVSDAAARTRVLAGLYNYNRDRLLALSDSRTDDILQAINQDQDLKSKNWHKPREQGDSHEEQAWLWTVVPPWTSKGEAEAWQMEVDRVQWFRARADLSRVNEEVNKLHAEFKRSILGYKNLSLSWESVAKHSALSEGARVYARKKAAMFNKLSEQCAQVFAKSRRDPEDKWDYTVTSAVSTATETTSKPSGSSSAAK